MNFKPFFFFLSKMLLWLPDQFLADYQSGPKCRNSEFKEKKKNIHQPDRSWGPCYKTGFHLSQGTSGLTPGFLHQGESLTGYIARVAPENLLQIRGQVWNEMASLFLEDFSDPCVQMGLNSEFQFIPNLNSVLIYSLLALRLLKPHQGSSCSK